MGLNKAKGNMYGFVTHTWNVIKGECPHDCEYCYMKRWGPQKEIRFDEKEMNTDLGKDNTIFVGSSCDMWAKDIPDEWIERIMNKIHRTGQDNNYLFQSKNPGRFNDFWEKMCINDRVCTTIETNRNYSKMGKNAPEPLERAAALASIHPLTIKMITIEPIMDFDLWDMLGLIKMVRPHQVNIGANSRRDIKLAEPSADKVERLIEELRRITKVHLKPNLKRLHWKKVIS